MMARIEDITVPTMATAPPELLSPLHRVPAGAEQEVEPELAEGGQAADEQGDDDATQQQQDEDSRPPAHPFEDDVTEGAGTPARRGDSR
jgi:hypothetical protein